mgnify:FL=1
MAHPAFRQNDAASLKSSLKFLKTNDQVIAYSINGAKVGDSWSSIVVIHNASLKSQTITLPASEKWNIVVKADKAGVKTLQTISGKTISAAAQSTLVLYSN